MSKWFGDEMDRSSSLGSVTMPKTRIFHGVLAAVIIMLSACGAVPTPQKPNQQNIEQELTSTPYSTSTPQATRNFFQNLPTPELTVQSPLPVQTFGDTKSSDATGTVVVEDSLASVRLSIKLQDTTSKKSLQQIQVQFISDGKEFLLVALDPAGQYLPAVKSGTY